MKRYLLCYSLLICRTAAADGCFIPEKAFPRLPSIPSQRALLSFRDGEEQLTIQSALDAEGQRFGWIIPVPAKPTKFERASAGLLKTLSMHTQPKVTHESRALSRRLFRCWCLAGAVLLWAGFVVGARVRMRWVVASLVLALLVGHFLPRVLPSRLWDKAAAKEGAGPAFSSTAGVRMEALLIVGSYEVALLDADSSAALNGWLGLNGFAALPGEGLSIVDDYIREGWRFVAAKLRREGAGLYRPHPLAITFPAPKPIYPLRLTALAKSSMRLELLVLSDQRATTKMLDTEFCDAFVKREQHPLDGPPLPYVWSKKFHAYVGHPGAAQAVWDGCWLTRLTGILQPEDMLEDAILELSSPEPYRQHLYSRLGARDTALLWALRLWGLLLPVALLAASWILRERSRRWRYLLPTALAAAMLSLLTGLAVYAALPKTDIVLMRAQKGTLPFEYDRRWREALDRLYERLRPDCTTSQLAAALRDDLRYGILQNTVEGGRMREEDSPGNCTLHRHSDGVVVRRYGYYGFPEDFLVPRDPTAYYLPLLRSRYWQAALQSLCRTRSPRVALPLIEQLSGGGRRHFHDICDALRRVTGFDFRTSQEERDAKELHARWTEWWRANQDQPRREWLRAAQGQRPLPAHQQDEQALTYCHTAKVIAARELALLGDDCGVPVLVKALQGEFLDDETKIDAALALALVGEEDGFRYLAPKLGNPRALEGLAKIGSPRAIELLIVEWARSSIRQGPGTRQIAQSLCAFRPALVAPSLIAEVRDSLPKMTGRDLMDGNLADMLRPLALAARADLPEDLADREQIKAFLRFVESRLRPEN